MPEYPDGKYEIWAKHPDEEDEHWFLVAWFPNLVMATARFEMAIRFNPSYEYQIHKHTTTVERSFTPKDSEEELCHECGAHARIGSVRTGSGVVLCPECFDKEVE